MIWPSRSNQYDYGLKNEKRGLPGLFGNTHFDIDKGLDFCMKTIGHQLKLTIRRSEGNGSIILEGRQLDTLEKVRESEVLIYLMETNIFKIDIVTIATTDLSLLRAFTQIEADLIIQTLRR